MKQLLSILALVAIFATSAFATDVSNTGSKTGKFTATVFCTPVLTSPTGAAVSVGNYFTGASAVASNGYTTAWTLIGPTTAGYTVTTTDLSVGLADDDATGALLKGTWAGTTIDVTSDAAISCTHAVSIVFTPTFVTPGLTAGTKNWTITVSVASTI